jgi:hypothetical protein
LQHRFAFPYCCTSVLPFGRLIRIVICYIQHLCELPKYLTWPFVAYRLLYAIFPCVSLGAMGTYNLGIRIWHNIKRKRNIPSQGEFRYRQ